MSDRRTILEVKNLKKYFARTKGLLRKEIGKVKAVDDVSFTMNEGETLGLVGESGSGKTTLGKSILRAIKPTAGEINFYVNGKKIDNYLYLGKKKLKNMRSYMTLICQDPYSSLNPRMNVFDILTEPYRIHNLYTTRRMMEEKAVDLLEKVHLNTDCLYRYPHAFSGGQRQRLAIARALSLNPRFIVADEPVSALDVSVQAQILGLLKDLQAKFAFTCLFIAHDLSVIEYISDRIIIMYVGRIMEIGSNSSIFKSPGHPYTEALLSSVPKPNPKLVKQPPKIRGEIADPANPPGGCYFHPRCPYAKDICKKEKPELVNISKDPDNPHYSSCHFAEKLLLVGV